MHDWNHVPGTLNAADYVSRGLTPPALTVNNNNNKLKFIPRSFYRNIQLRLTIKITLKIK